MKLSFNGKRIGAGILLLMALICVSNYYFEWRIFGQFNKQVMVGVFVVMFMYLFRVGPTLEEVQEHRDKKNREKDAPIGFRPWIYLVTLSIVMLIFVLIGPVFQIWRDEPVQREDWIELIVIEVLVVVAGLFGWYQVRRLQGRKGDRD